ADPDVRAVVLSSDLPAMFCAGLDLDIILGSNEETVRAFLNRLYIELWDVQRTLGKPSIAAVDGAARGGGMTLAISCDMIIAGTGASFGYPEINLALPPAIHFAHLHRIIGRYRAFDLLFTARAFDAREALSLGLVSRVVASGEALSEANAAARVIADKSPAAIALSRAAFHREADRTYTEGVARAVDDFCEAAMSPHAQEGLAAFLEKRKPQWP
ncbi:MAG TPA: enoyl-CoA hydratase/isomerase family protein, partial [Hyphomonadaceae bacterium]|nr:enoyl-CoA hydratase/isomerase family protein [Hyphomonadaceae bacterium]HPI47280.1 enoyl-CoA hydratase/isomerase family protein [Hyphomonadaceae bacterium]